ncbi:MAG: response regulator transcription factor [Pseudomonadota bacterium]
MNILIIDNDQFYTKGFIDLIEHNFKIKQMSNANSIKSASKLMAKMICIDLLFIDLDLPDISDYLLSKLLNNNIRFCSIISNTADLSKIHSAMRLRPLSFISKKSPPEKVITSVHKIVQGHQLLAPQMKQQLDAFDCAKKIFVLSKRQDEVLALLSNGLSNQEISKRLAISEHTVKSHVRCLFRLLDANNRIQCIQNAKSIGIL